MKLTAKSFGEFHHDVHGYAPFPWQQRLLERIVAEKKWPEILDLPTGSGKTTCIDVAVFALALDAENGELWCPRRIAMVVDRRVVVDQAAERGRKLASKLSGRATPGLDAVASRLASLSRDGEPLGVFTLRGGMPKDDGWARTPDQPLIIASTVDQLGSRLLMQGYGVNPRMAPIHAGLLANDTLVLLDEVHLSEPFAETLSQLTLLRSRFTALPSRFHVSFLSATPVVDKPSSRFELLEPDLASKDRLGQRLAASKKARLREAEDRTELEKRCVDQAQDLLTRHRTVAAVLNRVGSAATVAAQLRECVKDSADVVLLTGRMRPLDRDDVLRGLRQRIESGRQRSDDSRKLVVVATQCIEAGADFDFDALVTEAASLSALRQRFGRVDRLGDYQRAEGVIVRSKAKDDKDDPIYGDALTATWKWLEDNCSGGAKKKRGKKAEEPSVDFGVLALPAVSEEDRPQLLSPRKHAPLLLPAYLDLWSQTQPAPALVPDVSLFLHGPGSGPADVQIVWRADLDEELLSAKHLEEAIELVSTVRPSSLEAISLPFVAAKKWLAQGRSGFIADVEGAPERDDDALRGGAALRWRGEDSEIVDASQLRPGDTIIVPAARGGLSSEDLCFNASSKAVVKDLAERAALMGRGQVVLRLHARVLTGLGLAEVAPLLGEDVSASELLDALPAAETVEFWHRPWIQHLRRSPRRIATRTAASFGALIGKPLRREEVLALSQGAERDSIEGGVDLTTDEEDSVFAGRSVPLREHSRDVRDFAAEFARRLKLPPSLQDDVSLAGWVHDIGKADRRFQLLLRGGDAVELFKDPSAWAKSGIPENARSAQRRAAKLSKYPRGARHEVQSLAMLLQPENAKKLADKASDLELVRHLVASHHGHCRPFAPAVEDPEPVDVSLTDFDGWSFEPVSSENRLHRLDSSIPEQFWNLQSRLGWLELCWLEAILRLADHRASEEEQWREGES